MLLRLGNIDIPYNPEFRFMITTQMANPNFAPEIFMKVRGDKAQDQKDIEGNENRDNESMR